MAYEFWNRIIPKGLTVSLHEDECEYARPIGLYRALRDIHLPDEVDIVGHDASPSALVAHLIQCGAVEEMKYEQIHLGMFGNLHPRLFCRHESTTPAEFPNGAMIDICNICQMTLPNGSNSDYPRCNLSGCQTPVSEDGRMCADHIALNEAAMRFQAGREPMSEICKRFPQFPPEAFSAAIKRYLKFVGSSPAEADSPGEPV